MQKILNQIAANNSTTENEVKKEISEAISMAMERSKGNPEAESFWKNISKNGEEPTPDEVIKAIAAKIISKQNSKKK